MNGLGVSSLALKPLILFCIEVLIKKNPFCRGEMAQSVIAAQT